MLNTLSHGWIGLLVLLFCGSLWASEPIWIDVRTAEEFAAGHVESAVNIPYEEIGARISEVTTDSEAVIYLYCRSGRRSGIALETLEASGFSNAVNVGGLEDALKRAAEAPQP